MSLNNRDIQIIRSLPYVYSETKLQDAINKFVKLMYSPSVDMIRVMKSIRRAQEVGMTLPIYIRELTEEETVMAEEAMSLMMDKDRIKEKKEFMEKASEDEKLNIRYLFFLDRLKHYQEGKTWQNV